MRGWKLAAVLPVFAACEAIPTDPDPLVQSAGVEAHATADAAAPLLVIVAPGQLVTLERERGDTERAWVQAQLVVRKLSGRDGTAQMDGAILVVSAADGPMPQTSPNATWLRIEIRGGTIHPDGILHFSGVATALRNATGESITFDITGSARPHETIPDRIIWDTLESSVHHGAKFETAGAVRDLAGIFLA